MEIHAAEAEQYGSARALADSFGSPVFEPRWWPKNAGAVGYWLDRLPSSAHYRIGSTRPDGTPICVLGRPENRTGRLPEGDWYQPPELAALRGLVRTNGAQVHAVIHDEQQTIHLIGYASEAEVVRAVGSFRRVTAA